MCGIAGVVSATPVEAALLDDMAQRLAHRGPDGQGRHVAGNVGLLHTRLAIIDLEGGAQPLYNEDRSLALVANGEIYNYRELRAELETLGHRFATHSDCETLLHAYEAWGIAFLDRLQGMFAFALHDLQRGELILARDRLGIKPLYYCHDSRGLAFASEIKALLPWLGTPEVNPHGLAQFLQSNFTCAPQTLLQGVAKLPPAHLARIDVRTLQLELRAYWSPLQVTTLDLGLNDALERFDGLMQDVMDIHMRADVPLGLFLSGGVDSSLLAALLAQRVNEPLRTFSVGFPGSSVHNELDAARRIAEQFHTRHSVFEVSADDMLNCLPRSVWAADDLTADYANLPVSMLAEHAGQELKVVFSGEGGDEVFAGYGRYRAPWIRRTLAALRAPGSGGFRSKGIFDGTRSRLVQAAAGRSHVQLAAAVPAGVAAHPAALDAAAAHAIRRHRNLAARRPAGQGRSHADGLGHRRPRALPRSSGGRIRAGAAGCLQDRRAHRQALFAAVGRALSATRASVGAQEGLHRPGRRLAARRAPANPAQACCRSRKASAPGSIRRKSASCCTRSSRARSTARPCGRCSISPSGTASSSKVMEASRPIRRTRWHSLRNPMRGRVRYYSPRRMQGVSGNKAYP